MRADRITYPREIEPFDAAAPIRASCCGICGAHIHFWKHGANMAGESDLIMGHESAGRVIDPGDFSGRGVNGVRASDSRQGCRLQGHDQALAAGRTGDRS